MSGADEEVVAVTVWAWHSHEPYDFPKRASHSLTLYRVVTARCFFCAGSASRAQSRGMNAC